jgi:two-component system, OmpR family, sensor kinase
MLQSEIDQGLEEIALQVRGEIKAIDPAGSDITLIPPNLDMFQASTTYIAVFDVENQLLAHSSNVDETGLAPLNRLAQPRFTTITWDEQTDWRVLTTPLYFNGRSEVIGYLQVGRSLEHYTSLLQRLRWLLLLTGVGAVSVSLFLGALLTHSLLKPLDDIAGVALQITRAGDLSRRLPDLGRNDEIGRLTFVLNQTLERLERLFQSQQRLLTDVSHELRTPLTTIRGNVDLMKRMNMADPETLTVIQEETARMTRLVEDLMLLARADAGGLPIQRQAIDLDTIFLDVYRQVSSVQPPVELALQEIDQVCVWGDADRLKQLVLNLVDNAIKYTPPGGRVTLSLSQDETQAHIAVTDTGIGIPEEDIPLIFERFYRVDKSRARVQGGSGLGLSIVKWIIDAHGGQIDVQSQVGEGTTFTVSLPVIPPEKRPQPKSVAQAKDYGLRIIRSIPPSG